MLEKMKEIIAEQLNCDAESITLETSFKEDLDLGVILNVSSVDRDATSLFLGSLVDAGVIHEVRIALQSQNLGDGSGQSGLAVVDVTDGANVDVLQRAVKFFLFSHWKYPPLFKTNRCLL